MEKSFTSIPTKDEDEARMQAFQKMPSSPTPATAAIPSFAGESDADLYERVKSLERELEFVDIQESFVKDEMKNLRRELLRAKEEVKRIQSVPLVLGQFMELIDENHGIVLSTAGSTFYVRMLSTLDKEKLKPNASMALHR